MPNLPDALPSPLAELYDKPVWGLFKVNPKGSERKYTVNCKSNDPTTLRDYFTACQHKTDNHVIVLSVQLANNYLKTFNLNFYDIDKYKAAKFDPTLLDGLCAATYVEESPSGNGAHAFFTIPKDKIYNPTTVLPDGYEVDNTGFITMTFKQLSVTQEFFHITSIKLLANQKLTLYDIDKMNPLNKDGSLSPIWCYNMQNPDPRVLLDESELIPRGKKYLEPNSSSGMPGVSVYSGHRGEWDIVWSAHDAGILPRQTCLDPWGVHQALHRKSYMDVAELSKTVRAIDLDTGELLDISVDEFNKPAPEKSGRKHGKEPILDLSKVLSDDMFSQLVYSITNAADAIENPIAAINEAFGILSLVCDCTYSFGGRTIPTHYGVNVGDTFAGKTVTRESALYHLREAGIGSEHVQKGKSTFEALEDKCIDKLTARPNILFNPDEIGFIFEASKKNSMYSSLAQFILSAFSLSYGPHHRRSLVGSEDKSVQSLKFTMVGGSTIESLKHGAITKQDAMNGDLNRKLLLNVNGVTVDHVKEDPEGGFANEYVISRLKHIWKKQDRPKPEGLGEIPKLYDRKKPLVIVPMTEDAKTFNYKQRKDIVKEQVDSLRGRRPLLSKLLALWRVVINNPDNPVIDKQDLEWSDYIVGHSIDFTQYLFDVHLSENVSVDSERDLIRVLKSAGINGMKRAHAMTKANWNNTLDSEMRNRKQKAMVEEGIIVYARVKLSSGQTVSLLILTEFLSEAVYIRIARKETINIVDLK